MRRKHATSWLLWGSALALLSSCGSTVAGKAYSTAPWWNKHLAGYWYILKRDATNLYQTFDRHLLNYDWDDPNLKD